MDLEKKSGEKLTANPTIPQLMLFDNFEGYVFAYTNSKKKTSGI